MKRTALVATLFCLSCSGAQAGINTADWPASAEDSIRLQAVTVKDAMLAVRLNAPQAEERGQAPDAFPYAKARERFRDGLRPTTNELRGHWLLQGMVAQHDPDGGVFDPEGIGAGKAGQKGVLVFLDNGNAVLSDAPDDKALAVRATRVQKLGKDEAPSPVKPKVSFDEKSALFTYQTIVKGSAAAEYRYECRQTDEAHLLCRVSFDAVSGAGDLTSYYVETAYQSFVKMK